MSAVMGVLARELMLAARRREQWAQPLVFYAIVALLFAFGAPPQAPWLQTAAPAILWVGALLAALLPLEQVFRGDWQDGVLEQMALAPQPLELLVLAKLVAHWLVIGLPLALLAPALGLALGLPLAAVGTLVASLLLGLPALVLLAGFASALTMGLARAGLLLPVLVLPLAAPVLIFGAGAVRAAQLGLSAEAPLYFLAAILVLSLCGVPLVIAAALRNAFE